MPTVYNKEHYDPIAKERFPWMNRRERKRITVLLRRAEYLGEVSKGPDSNDWIKAEQAALEMVFDMLEEIENVD